MIRLARLDDIPKIIPLVEQFATEQNMRDDLDIKSTAKVLSMSVSDDLCYVSEQDGIVGVIGGIKSPNIWNSWKTQIDEIIYYVYPYYRKGSTGARLLSTYTEAIKDNCYISTLKLMANSPDLTQHYKKLGYVETETTYMRIS